MTPTEQFLFLAKRYKEQAEEDVKKWTNFLEKHGETEKDAGAKFACSDGLATLEHETCDLRCINVPTGGDDYDIEWVVIEHHMQGPREREIGRAATPLEALQDAFGG